MERGGCKSGTTAARRAPHLRVSAEVRPRSSKARQATGAPVELVEAVVSTAWRAEGGTRDAGGGDGVAEGRLVSGAGAPAAVAAVGGRAPMGGGGGGKGAAGPGGAITAAGSGGGAAVGNDDGAAPGSPATGVGSAP